MCKKKFVCHHYSAPMVILYKNPFVVFDYCGIMIGTNCFTGLQVWNHSEEHTNQNKLTQQGFLTNSAKYLKENNKVAYWKETCNFWDFCYTYFPEYLTPSFPKDEKYKLFIKSEADMATATINTRPNSKSEAHNIANKSIIYYQKK
jgi:hypothetical protein